MKDPVAEARKLLVKEFNRLRGLLSDERTRRRGAIVRRIHEIQRMLDPAYRYSSQAGQDVIVDGLMGRKRGGTFLDIGGYDGVTGSNTLFFEQVRGWTGVLVEPVPSQLERAKEMRSCPCLGVAVAAKPGKADFIEVTEGYTQMSGLADSYDAKLLETVRKNERHGERVFKVETRTLPAIMKDAGLTDPDFMSLDIEGGELAVLEAFPFDAHKVGVWAIENNTGDPRIHAIMRANGYRLAEFAGPDEIYQRVEK